MEKIPNPTREASMNFATLEEALRYCSAELKAGRCAIVWPTDGAGFRVAAWRFENPLRRPELACFAPTVPQDIDGLPSRRQRGLLESWGVRRRQ